MKKIAAFVLTFCLVTAAPFSALADEGEGFLFFEEQPAQEEVLAEGNDDGDEQILAEDEAAAFAADGVLAELNTDEHIRYINGIEGFFKPDNSIKRGEAASIIYLLLKEQPEAGEARFDDVTSQWYSNQVNALASLGVIEGYGELFKPASNITRAEFVTILARCFPAKSSEETFDDVPEDSWMYPAVATAIAYKWVEGYGDNEFRPSKHITRAEAVTIINRALGRKADTEVLGEHKYRLFPDVAFGAWYYNDIMESAVEHSHESLDGAETWSEFTEPKSALAPGLYNVGTELYYVQPNGLFLYNGSYNGLDFNAAAKYTSKNETLDRLMGNLIAGNTSDKDSRDIKLRKMYVYTRDRFAYQGRPEIPKGTTGWETQRALEMIADAKGNCYSFAALFYHLARRLGFTPYTVIGEFGGGPHCWLEYNTGSGVVVYDPQLEKRYIERGNNMDFYGQPYSKLPDMYSK